jgi:hypothetical protein
MMRPHDVTGPAGPLGSTTPAPTDARANSSRTILLVIGLAGLSVCLFAFGVLADDVRSQESGFLDAAVTPFFHGLAPPPLDAVMNAATFTGSDPTLLIVLAIAVITLAWWGRRREELFLVVALAGNLIVNEMVNTAQCKGPDIDRARFRRRASLERGSLRFPGVRENPTRWSRQPPKK